MTEPVWVPQKPLKTREVVATSLPVDLATDTWRTMLRLPLRVMPGDVLYVDASARVTNDCGYTIGCGWHPWAYNVDKGGSAGPWWRIGPSYGDNVDKARHHLPLSLTTVYDVPDDWPVDPDTGEGDRICIALRADAHSTAAVSGDKLTVDTGMGELIVTRWAKTYP
ncbi:hypothetical protein [Streptomyces antibioticus]|uniref:hypothetical protein n=1 Tax=Streptomyces antibioticus TaxID=1890 RepID=UPI0033A3A22E